MHDCTAHFYYDDDDDDDNGDDDDLLDLYAARGKHE